MERAPFENMLTDLCEQELGFEPTKDELLYFWTTYEGLNTEEWSEEVAQSLHEIRWYEGQTAQAMRHYLTIYEEIELDERQFEILKLTLQIGLAEKDGSLATR